LAPPDFLESFVESSADKFTTTAEFRGILALLDCSAVIIRLDTLDKILRYLSSKAALFLQQA
jgi:hypothetical protein